MSTQEEIQDDLIHLGISAELNDFIPVPPKLKEGIADPLLHWLLNDSNVWELVCDFYTH